MFPNTFFNNNVNSKLGLYRMDFWFNTESEVIDTTQKIRVTGSSSFIEKVKKMLIDILHEHNIKFLAFDVYYRNDHMNRNNTVLTITLVSDEAQRLLNEIDNTLKSSEQTTSTVDALSVASLRI